MQFSIKNFFSKFDQIPIKLWTWSPLQIKYLKENFMFCTAYAARFGISRRFTTLFCVNRHILVWVWQKVVSYDHKNSIFLQ